MDFELSDEQTMLRDTVREVLTRTYDIETVRAISETELGWDKGVWKSLAEIGILGLTVAEDDGGMGAGPVEFTSVMTEIGRALAPEPYLDSVLIPSAVLARSADDDTRSELLGALAAGELLMAFAHLEPGDRWPSARVRVAAADGRLTGIKTLVGHGDCAQKLIVSARSGDEIGLFLVDADAEGVTRTPYRTHDRRRGAQFEFADTPAMRLGSGDATDILTEVEVITQTALCAEAVGAMERTLDLTTEYLRTRKQFGVPLSTFQTLSHRAADMYVLLELARSMNLYAVGSLADGVTDPMVASRAKLQICQSARGIGQEAIQMHGGIGMTAEYPVGHYVSRLTAISHTLGNADDHLARLSRSVGDRDMLSVG